MKITVFRTVLIGILQFRKLLKWEQDLRELSSSIFVEKKIDSINKLRKTLTTGFHTAGFLIISNIFIMSLQEADMAYRFIGPQNPSCFKEYINILFKNVQQSLRVDLK